MRGDAKTKSALRICLSHVNADDAALEFGRDELRAEVHCEFVELSACGKFEETRAGFRDGPEIGSIIAERVFEKRSLIV